MTSSMTMSVCFLMSLSRLRTGAASKGSQASSTSRSMTSFSCSGVGAGPWVCSMTSICLSTSMASRSALARSRGVLPPVASAMRPRSSAESLRSSAANRPARLDSASSSRRPCAIWVDKLIKGHRLAFERLGGVLLGFRHADGVDQDKAVPSTIRAVFLDCGTQKRGAIAAWDRACS